MASSVFGRLTLAGRQAALDAVCRGVGAAIDFDPRQNLYVFSDPRGGSTWLTEALSEIPGTAILWEPLHKRKVRLWAEVDLGWRPSLADDEPRDDVQAALERVFRGKALNEWMRASPHAAYFRADRLLVKVCRGNALLPWLTRQFDFAYAPVLFVRHPFAVVASQLAWGAWRGYRLGNIDPSTFEPGSLRATHADVLTSITTKEESLAAKWCLTTLQAMRHPRSGRDWITVHYEHLLLNPHREVERIFSHWGLPVPEGTLDRLGTASATTKEATFEQGPEAQLYKWRDKLTEEQIDRMAAVLEGFGVTEYTRAPLPSTA